jgi:hypothetical protein
MSRPETRTGYCSLETCGLEWEISRNCQAGVEKMEIPYLYEDWERVEHDPLHLAARGATEIAKVWQGSEWHCIQHHVCSDVEVGRPKDDCAGITL